MSLRLLVLAIVSFIHTGTSAATTQRATPAHLVTKGGKALWDNTTEFRVHFHVHAVRSVPTIFPDETKHTILHLVPRQEIPGRHDFTAPISREFEATLKRIGIRDLRKHFTGRDIEVKGTVSATGLDLILSKTVWTYHISLRSLDQIVYLRYSKE
ncbi:MAG: hypothetical protein ACPGVU_23135 [Limisphaerales bacterium]